MHGDRLPESRPAASASEGTLDSFSLPGPVSTAHLSPLRKAAIVLVSLDQSLASQLLANLDRVAGEAVTLEIARLERMDPAEQAAVLDEFLGLGAAPALLRVRRPRADERPRHSRLLQARRDGRLGPGDRRRGRPGPGQDPGRSMRLHPPALRQYLEGMGPFRLSDAEAAQVEIAERFRRLNDRGSVSLPDPSGRDEVLV